jgi:hypothetical protein
VAVIKIIDSKSTLPPVIKVIVGGTPIIFKNKTTSLVF